MRAEPYSGVPHASKLMASKIQTFWLIAASEKWGFEGRSECALELSEKQEIEITFSL